MKANSKIYKLATSGLMMLTLWLSPFIFAGSAAAQAPQAKNIVIVHGAFADGSGWDKVYNILTAKGYHVSIVQNPLSSLSDDVKATQRVLDRQLGPTVLVGHSWGGTVITEAGTDAKVVALVYVAAFQPDKGETTAKWAGSLPPAPENGIGAPDATGYIFYSKEKFHDGFCADVSDEEADFMYASQAPIFAQSFITPLKAAAWKTKKSFGIVASDDKSINPDIERNMYKRSNTIVTEIKASHVPFISHPEEVAAVIIAAAVGTK